MIAIIDYGVGNLFSLRSSLKYLMMEALVTSRKEDLEAADQVILPGVGAFSDAIGKLRNTGLVETLLKEAEKGKPILGICLGMQLLFEKSFEYGEHEGLGLIRGKVASIEKDLPDRKGGRLKVPHIGWNSLKFEKEDPIFQYCADGEYVYYVHSFYGKECAASTIASSDYDVKIPGVVKHNNVYGMQFHPEKSGETGLRLLKAFAEVKGEKK